MTAQAEVNYQCPKCKDEEGYIVSGEGGREVWRFCECRKKRQMERMFKASEITEEFAKKTFGNFDVESVNELVQAAYETARGYVVDFQSIRSQRQNSIALLGRPGCGKTHLLMATANNLLTKGIQAVYFPWIEGFNELKDNLSTLDERIRRFQQAEVLFIDDMYKGAEKPTTFEMKQSFAIINYRYLNNLPMMISSERTFRQMCDIDEAIGSRLREMAKGRTVTISGGIELNYRLRED